MAHTHEYDCIVCGAHLDTQDQLSKHNKEQHLRNATGMERPRQQNRNDSRGDTRREPIGDREP